MNSAYTFQAIVVMAVVTFLIRAFPFLLFGRKNARPPELVLYLGNVIAPGGHRHAGGLLRPETWSSSAPLSEAPELIAAAATVLLHLRWRNSLLSIFGGTALYMVLIRTLFA